MIDTAIKLRNQYGAISQAFLICKLKINSNTASRIMKQIDCMHKKKIEPRVIPVTELRRLRRL